MSRCDPFYSVNCLFEPTVGGSPIETGSPEELRLLIYRMWSSSPLHQLVDRVLTHV